MAARRAFEDFIHDLRFASRQLLKDRGFAAVATLTLALGIGATTTLFTVLDAVVLSPLPLREPDRLVDLATTWQGAPGAVSVGNYFLMKERARTLQDLAARTSSTFNLIGSGEPERILGARVTASYFAVLGRGAALGRVFTEAEDAPGAAPVVVLSDGLFTRRFGREPSVVGRSLILNGRPHTVLGVMPKDLRIPGDATEMWTPIAFGVDRSFDGHYLVVTARLKSGVTREQLDEDAAALTTMAREAAPRNNDGRKVIAARLLDRVVGDYRQRLAILLFAVLLVFLIACVNVASLLMARGAARAKEISVRAALGAGRLRIARQLMTEALLLCALGAGAGVGLAAVALPVFVSQGPTDVPRLAEARLSLSTLGVASLFALMATLIAGVVPALRESRAGLSSGAGQAARGSTGGVRDRVRQAFVATEVALALMLLMGAGLLIRSAANLDRVAPGFEPRNLLTARLALPIGAYPGEEKPADAMSRMVANLVASPGVAEAAASTRPPLIGDVSYGLRIEGKEDTPANRIDGRMQLVTSGYLETLRVPLRRGRAFVAADRRDSPRVMVVSETLARLAWPGESPIGKRVACCESNDGEPVWKEVVGVVEDTRARGIAAPGLPEFYLPMDQAPRRAFEANGGSITLVLRAANGNPDALTSIVRSVVKDVDPSLPLYDVATMTSRVAASTALARFNRLLLTCLGLVGLLLSGIGIYGIVAYLVSLRTREIGVRLALGAVPRDVVALMARQGAGAILAGLLLGALGVWAQGRAFESVVFGVSGRDPATFAATSAVLLLVALAASLVPAWRASRVEPTGALAEP